VVVSSIVGCLSVSDGGAGQEGEAIGFEEAARFGTKVVRYLSVCRRMSTLCA